MLGLILDSVVLTSQWKLSVSYHNTDKLAVTSEQTLHYRAKSQCYFELHKLGYPLVYCCLTDTLHNSSGSKQ